MKCRYFIIQVLLILQLSSCKIERDFNSDILQIKKCNNEVFKRNWVNYPAIIKEQKLNNEIFVIGDIHGNITSLKLLLQKSGIVENNDTNIKWLKKNVILIFTGDYINKGENSLAVINYLIEVEKQAKDNLSKIITLAGNHEIGFLNDPDVKKSKDFRQHIEKHNLKLCDDVYSSSSIYGTWLRNLSAAVVINSAFISHTGWYSQNSTNEIETKYKEYVDKQNYNNEFMCGNKKVIKNTDMGFFNAEVWWTNVIHFDAILQFLNVKQIIFGHDPGAFKNKGEIIGFFGDNNGKALIKIDVEMWSNKYSPSMLRCKNTYNNGLCKWERFNNKQIFEDVPISTDIPPNQEISEENNGC